MDALDLAWDTFDFHSFEVAKLEEEHIENMFKIKSLIKKEIIEPRSKQIRLKKKASNCCDQIVVSYKKQLSSIDDIIKLYKSGIKIPESRYVDPQFLNELKLLTATLMQEMITYKKEIEKLLG